MKNQFIPFLIAITFSSVTLAQSVGSISASEGVELIKNKISPDFPVELRRFLERDLEVISKIAGNGGSKLHYQHFHGPVDGKTYINWILKNIDYINYDQNFKISYANALAVSPFYNFVLKRGVVIAPKFFELFQSGRIPVLIHEIYHLAVNSRHVDCGVFQTDPPIDFTRIDNKFYSNLVTSDQISNNKVNSCDERSDGAYGIQFIFTSNLLKHCINCEIDNGLPNLNRSDLYRRSIEAISRVREKTSRTILLKDYNENPSLDSDPNL